MTGASRGGTVDCLVERDFPVAVVRMTGRLSLATTPEVRGALQKCLVAQPSSVVVDLAGLTVDDDLGLTVFTAFARSAADWPGCPVVLCAADEATRRGLDRIAVSRYLPIFPDRWHALAAVDSLIAPRRYRQRLVPSAACAQQARAMAVNACRAWALPDLAEDAELVVTELVSNAVRHANTEVEVSIVLRERFVHIGVRDGSDELPRRILADPTTGEGGRGLLLVDALADSWGSTPTSDGKVVWATLRISPSRPCRQRGRSPL